jgi:hypothetical protein
MQPVFFSEENSLPGNFTFSVSFKKLYRNDIDILFI